MRIGELASRTGVSARSLRYYEQQGLLTSTRSASRQRHYGSDEVVRVELIQLLYSAGLSSRTIAEMLPCVDTPNAEASAAALKLATEERDRLSERIARLLHARDTLDELLAASTRREWDCRKNGEVPGAYRLRNASMSGGGSETGSVGSVLGS